MKLDFLDVDEECKSLVEIKVSNTYNKKGYHPEGFFSEKIFGPVKTATCGCGVYWGRSKLGEICSLCDVEITFSNERRKRFGKIKLPFQVLNPIMYHLIIRAGKTTYKDIMENILFHDTVAGYYYDTEIEKYCKVEYTFKEKESDEDEELEYPRQYEFFTGLEGIYEIVSREAKNRREESVTWKYIDDNINKFYLNNIIVVPPDFRPSAKDIKNEQKTDVLNRYYNELLNYTSIFGKDSLGVEHLEGIGNITLKNVQRHVMNLYDFIFEKLSRKKGLIRGSILGKRIDFSGRAVICPDPTLSLEDCSVPYFMVLEIFKLDIANYLIEHRLQQRYDRAIDYIDDCILRKNYELYESVCECCDGKWAILNRQPTLHRMGILAFKIKTSRDNVIKIHPLICEPFNADFDGDQMALYRPLYECTEQECEEKLSVLNNLICPTTGGLIIGVNQDVVLGLYLLTGWDSESEVSFIDWEGNKHITTKGRILFNNTLPEQYPFINSIIDKKTLTVVLDDITRTHKPEEVTAILDDIKELGFKYTTLYGCTMSLKNMKFSDKGLVDSILDDDELRWDEKFDKLQSKEVSDLVKSSFPYSVFIDSGSRGSWDQANQIVLCRGYLSNFSGEIIKTPVKSNLVSGLSREEFFISCYGSRKGLLDTALNTGNAGYLTRKLVYSSVNLEFDDTLDDCGTLDMLDIDLTRLDINNQSLAKSLIGRYYFDFDKDDYEEITYANYHTFVDKTIKIRSPILCTGKNGICKRCYGSSNSALHSKYIGVVAAQAIGEVSTQLVLRTFHTSGVAKKAHGERGDIQKDIVNDLANVNKLFHCTNSISYIDIIYDLFKIYSEYKPILLVHYECIISQMMRDPDGGRWRLYADRKNNPAIMTSIETVPSKESWVLGLAFCKPKAYIIDGILKDNSAPSGILEKIMVDGEL